MTPKDIMQHLSDKIPGSTYFTWSEALYLPKLQAYAVPTQEQINNIASQATSLDKVREYYKKPLVITSWLRTPLYNNLIGGATNSAHLIGLATDFIISGIQPIDIQKELEKRKDIWPWGGERNTTTWTHLHKRDSNWFNK